MAVHRSPHADLDFSDLESMDLPEDIRERVKQARIEAADIQAALEPSHIWSWSELLERLGYACEKARQNGCRSGMS